MENKLYYVASGMLRTKLMNFGIDFQPYTDIVGPFRQPRPLEEVAITIYRELYETYTTNDEN